VSEECETKTRVVRIKEEMGVTTFRKERAMLKYCNTALLPDAVKAE